MDMTFRQKDEIETVLGNRANKKTRVTKGWWYYINTTVLDELEVFANWIKKLLGFYEKFDF